MLEPWHDGTTIFSPFTNQAFFSSLPLSVFPSPSVNIPRLPSGYEVEIHDKFCLHNQNT